MEEFIMDGEQAKRFVEDGETYLKTKDGTKVKVASLAASVATEMKGTNGDEPEKKEGRTPMTRGVNKLIILGWVASEVKSTTDENGVELASFNVATTDAWKEKGAEEASEHVEITHVIVQGNLVKPVTDWVKKDSEIYVEGKKITNIWKDKEDKEQSAVSLYASAVHFVSPKQQGAKSEEPKKDMPF